MIRRAPSYSRIPRRAFTLVELLVVIGIIAILIATLLPTLSKSRQSANSLKCMSNLRTIGQGIQLYAAQSKGVLPYGFWNGSDPLGGPADNARRSDWRVLVQNMLSKSSGLTYTESAAAGGDATVVATDVFGDVDVPDNAGVLSYGAHPRLMPEISAPEPRILNTTGRRVYPSPYKLSRIKRSAEVLLIADASLAPIVEFGNRMQANATLYNIDRGAWKGGAPGSGTPPSYLLDDYSSPAMAAFGPNTSIDLSYGAGSGPINVDATANNTQNPPQWGNIRFRHMRNTVANVLMADGHVESHRFKDKTNVTLKRLNVNVNPQ